MAEPADKAFLEWFNSHFRDLSRSLRRGFDYNKAANWSLIRSRVIKDFGSRVWGLIARKEFITHSIWSEVSKAFPKATGDKLSSMCRVVGHVRAHIATVQRGREARRNYTDALFHNGRTLKQRLDKTREHIVVPHFRKSVFRYKCGVRYAYQCVDTLDECSMAIEKRYGNRRSRRGSLGYGVVEAVVNGKVLRSSVFSPLLLGPMAAGNMYCRVKYAADRWPYGSSCLGGYKFDIRDGRQVWLVKLATRKRAGFIHDYFYAALINSRWALAPNLRKLDSEIMSMAATHFANHQHRDVLATCKNDKITLRACWDAVKGDAREFLRSGLSDTHEFLGMDIPRYWELPNSVPFI